MGRDRTKSPEEEDAENGAPSKKDHSRIKSKRKLESEPESESEEGSKHSSRSKKKEKEKEKKRSRKSRSDDDSLSSSSYSESESSEYSSEEEDEEERRRRKRRERKRREEREEKERRRRRREKEKKRRKERDDGDKKKKKKKKRKKKEEKGSEKGKKGAVTDSWGKYGVIRETDMWNKRPEFTAWLAEVKQVNLESLPNWEEKQMFKQFMEDHNTATFPSKKYYSLDAHFKRKIEKEMKKGVKNVRQTERTVFNDEEIRRQEMQQVRERQKEEQVEALKREMQSGMAQAMKEQAQLREEMAYHFKLGNFEAAAAIQRRLDPDLPM